MGGASIQSSREAFGNSHGLLTGIASVLAVRILSYEDFIVAATLRVFDNVEVVAEPSTGIEAVGKIESARPDFAFLDLDTPEVDGLGFVRMVRNDRVPLFASSPPMTNTRYVPSK